MKSSDFLRLDQYETIYIGENKLKQVLPTHEKIACTTVIYHNITYICLLMIYLSIFFYLNMWFFDLYVYMWYIYIYTPYICILYIYVILQILRKTRQTTTSFLVPPTRHQPFAWSGRVGNGESKNFSWDTRYMSWWQLWFFPKRFFPTWEQTYPLLNALFESMIFLFM